MFLKNLELQGFKSFAGKTLLEFKEGITGIVGPNGSGKSNISDAVKWVLGEQSAKQLRGGRMEDIIFAGTEARKPVGFAGVTITFENSDRKLPIDYDEVTVSRKVYRSGESEYRINGNSCRLRDIEELFYDTGIGKEGYSIIGQGRIDKILSGKADERRELFDEAAGIVKYKRRKERAIKQLALENENLVRVSDILSELEVRVEPLKKQSDKAKQYLSLKEELKRFDCNLFILKSDEINKELKELESKISIADSDINKANEEYNIAKSGYSELEQKLDKLNNKEDEIRESTEAENKKIQDFSASSGITEEQIRNIKENISETDLDISRLEKEIPEKEKEIQDVLDEKNALKEAVEDFNQKQSDLESNLENIKKASEEFDKEEQKNNALILENVKEQANASALSEKLQYRLNLLNEELNKEKEINGQRLEQKSIHDKQLSEAKKIFEEASKKVNDAVALKNNLRDMIRKNAEEESRDIGRLNSLNSSLMKESSELNALKAVTERYDGYAESIKKIMAAEQANEGVCGVVADIIKTELTYETAIETALGGSMQHIVTETEKDAKKLIEFLKSNKAGRATFLPLDAIKAKGTLYSKDFIEEDGIVGVASELVNADSKYQNLVLYLLGRIVVVDNIDNALKLAKKNSYSLRVVTLEGEMLNPGGSMTGGSYKHAGNLLSRRRKLTDFSSKIEKLKLEVASLEELIKKHKEEKESLRIKFEKASEEAENAGLKRNTAGINLNIIEEKAKSLYLESTSNRIDEISKEIEETKKSLNSAKENHDNLKSLEIQLKTSIEEGEKNAQINSSDLEKVSKELEELKLSYSSTIQKDSWLQEQLDRLYSELEMIKTELSSAKVKKGELQDSLNQKEQKNIETSKAVETSKNIIEKLRDESEKIKNERNLLNENNKNFFSKIESLSELLSELDKEKFRLSSKKEKIDNQLEEMTDYMWQEYELTYSYARELRDSQLDNLSDMQKKVKDLKAEIRALGDVNVNAIDEYKEVNERYEFLSNQHDDLISATASLKNVIEDLDKGMREQFTLKFKEINNEFNTVFKKLFGGGKGSVSLDEEADVLEADISITAQPPGKKLQNVLQLSGGERTLTAIALLFAIQNLKPSPFCLLDEIEAALDDANVGRFAAFLKQLADKTQYIIITHRRGTMAAADRLYGITMQEKGISTMVSVKLNK